MSASSTCRRVLSAAIGAALALAGLGLPAGAPAASAATTDPKPAVTVQVTAVSPSILRPGQDLTVRATMTNTSDQAIAQPSASLRLSRFRLGTRSEVDAWASAVTCTARCPQVATAPIVGPLTPGQSATVEIVVPADSVRLLDLPDAWGPRGLSVEALDGSAQVGIQRTFLLWFTDSTVPRTPVSVLVPVVGPAADPLSQAGAGTGATTTVSAQMDSLTAVGGRLHDLSTMLAANPGIGVAVDPALLAQAAAGSSQARAWAQTFNADLGRHDVVTLPWSDPDVGAAAHANRDELVQLAVDASAASDVKAPGILWAAGGGSVDQATAGVSARVGAPAIVVEPGAVTVDEASGRTPEARVTVKTADGSVPVLAPDEELTQLLADPTAVDPEATPATTVQRALSELAVVTRENDTDPPRLLLAPGRVWQPDTATVTALLDALRSTPWVRLADASTLLVADAATTAGSLPSTADDPAELDAPTVRRLADARQRAVDFAGVTSEPETLLAGVDAEVVAPLAVAWRADPVGRADLASRVIADVEARTTGLSIGRLSDVNVISSTSEIPVTVTNALSVPATVLLDLLPRKACLEVGKVDPVTVAAGSEQVVRVQLHALANCEVIVVARLTARDGAPVSAPATFTARVAPTIENVGTIVVGILLAIGLVLGIARTVRRGQSARRGARIEAETPHDPT